jgi:hypothetical protein
LKYRKMLFLVLLSVSLKCILVPPGEHRSL